MDKILGRDIVTKTALLGLQRTPFMKKAVMF
jgi:hypothetical protein